ncbi:MULTISPECIES: BTAD domain-containing putative transcriptional regulator [unclassified Streptomyces]|uniref:BTAD domain-containing putative transcriptional regulator n=1 Tax=unclassified Streptomyces TaxID=2593676 RepID=UPI0038148EB6
MEVFDDRCSLVLGGTKQRATLGYLLLQANRVVATSQLVNALWSIDDAPMSARKILQNAVWGLRRVLSKPEGPDELTVLVTQAPGYKLTVHPDDVDLFRFQRQVDAGREALVAGEPERAAQILREALALWRGPVLADLVEAGINWPELSAAQNAQWAAMEDYFEAELACGRHLAVLGELEAMVESMELRERSSGQLMLALYRSGRQADALNVYSRVRAALVEELGLEPGRELQTLQHAILAHDPALTSPTMVGHGGPAEHGAVILNQAAGMREAAPAAPLAPETAVGPDVVRTPQPPARTLQPAVRTPRPAGPDQGVGHHPSAARPSAAEHAGEPLPGTLPQPPTRLGGLKAAPQETPPLRELVVLPGGASAPVTAGAGPAQGRRGARGERKSVSALLVQPRLGPEAAGIDPPDMDEMLEELALRIRENIEHFGGTVSATIGSVSIAFFGAQGECEDGAERAVMAALTICDELRADENSAPAMRLQQGLSFRAAVVTGEALVRYRAQGDGPLSISGSLLDRCHALLSTAGRGEIRACETTRHATEATVAYRRIEDGEWTVQGIRREDMGKDSMPTVEREYELDLLRGLVERTRHRSTSHLVTVLGDAGTGKTRFLTEFEQQIADRSYLARFRVRPGDAYGGLSPVHAVQRHMINAICSIQPADSPQQAMEKLIGTIRRLVDDESRVARLLECLGPYVDPSVGELIMYDTQLELTSWRQFLERTVLDQPLVLVVDDLHGADDELVDFVSGLADLSRVPVLVVASARPELLRRRPDWGGGKQHVTTITLEALSDAAVDQLIDYLLSPARSEQKGATRWFNRRLCASAGDRPDERRQYIRTLLRMSAPGRFFTGNAVRCVTQGGPMLSGGGRA